MNDEERKGREGRKDFPWRSSLCGLGLLCVLCSGALAQEPVSGAKDKTREVTVTGCLARGADGGFTLIGGRAEPLASNQPVGTTMQTEPSGSGTRPAPALVWRITGATDLEKHVGHRVQVTGRAPASSSTTETTTTAEDKKGSPLEAQSIKVLAPGCS